MADILCLGLVVADVVGMPLDRLPRPGTLAPCPHISLHPGGCAVNTGSALARLGLKVGLIGGLGQDGFAGYLRQELASRSLNIKGLHTYKNAATSASMVAVNSRGERAFIHHVGANASLSESDIDWSLVRKHRFLHVGGSFLMPRLDGAPLARVLKRARGLGLKTSLDTVYNPRLKWAKLLKPCLPHLDYFLPSYEEARQISKKSRPLDMALAFQNLGASAVAIKMGEKGSFVHDGIRGLQVKAPAIRAVDTTGAGDAFCAGFLAARFWGWDLEQSARFGNVVGAACCLGVGAYAGIPGKKRALAMLRRFYDHA